MEPGCYFIDALLVPAMENAKTSKFFNREVIGRFKDFGGVRIESDVVLSIHLIFHLLLNNENFLLWHQYLTCLESDFSHIFW